MVRFSETNSECLDKPKHLCYAFAGRTRSIWNLRKVKTERHIWLYRAPTHYYVPFSNDTAQLYIFWSAELPSRKILLQSILIGRRKYVNTGKARAPVRILDVKELQNIENDI